MLMLLFFMGLVLLLLLLHHIIEVAEAHVTSQNAEYKTGDAKYNETSALPSDLLITSNRRIPRKLARPLQQDTDDGCLVSYPLNGTFLKAPPYWRYENCDSRSYNRSDANICLANRTIYFIGISTTRQMAFDLSSLLGGLGVDSRDKQKEKCAKVSDKWADSCHENLSNNIAIKYLFFHWMDGFNYTSRGGFPYFLNKTHTKLNTPNEVLSEAGEPEAYPFDMCTSFDTSDCIKSFLLDSKPKDILIFSVGGPYGTHSKVVNFTEYLVESAKPFRKYLNSYFHGHFIFQVTLAEMFNNWLWRNPLNFQVNALLYEALFKPNIIGNNNSIKNWFIIDQWSINRQRKRLYEDRVHFGGPLSMATVYQILTKVCPNLGSPFSNNISLLPNDIDLELKTIKIATSSSSGDRDLYKPKPDNIDIHSRSETIKTFEENDVISDSSSRLVLINKKSYCRQYVQVSQSSSNSINLSLNEIDLLPSDNAFRLNCTNGLLIRIISSKSIWQFCDGKILRFPDFASFARLGYDTSEVQVLPIDTIPFNLLSNLFVQDRCGLPIGNYAAKSRRR